MPVDRQSSLSPHRVGASRRSTRGLSIVEMMVGLAVGLIVAAAATTMMLSQLREARRLSTETQLQQDVRAVSELIARELRKAGFWALPNNGFWSTGSASTRAPLNPYAGLQFSGTSFPADSIEFWVSTSLRDVAHNLAASQLTENSTADTTDKRGFRLVNGGIDYFDGMHWQPLTASGSINIGSLNFTPVVQCQPVSEFEANVCTAGAANCPREASAVRIDFSLSATAVSDSSVSRTSSGSVVLRNAAAWGCTGS